MKKIRVSAILGMTFLTLACSDSISLEDAKKRESGGLEKLYIQIAATAAPVSCTNASDWKWMPIGAKACGGPTGYIPYHISVDENHLKNLVSTYTDQQKAFNKKWGAISDCSIPIQPSGVKCENGKPVLAYDSPVM